MDEDVLGQRDAGGHEQRGPEDRVELEDVLADDVVGRRPEAVHQVLPGPRVGERRVVVEQRVEPHVEDVAGVPGNGHPPFKTRPREGDVL